MVTVFIKQKSCDTIMTDHVEAGDRLLICRFLLSLTHMMPILSGAGKTNNNNEVQVKLKMGYYGRVEKKR
jgi:hypothetical protein